MSADEVASLLPLALIISLFFATIFLTLWLKERKARNQLSHRFANIISVDEELKRVEAEKESISRETDKLKADYKKKRKVYDDLRHQVAIFDEQVSFAEYGVYEPHFDFGDSEAYKRMIKAVRDEQKALIKEKRATHAPGNWTVDGSASKGRTMMNRATRLALRAFNAEADAAIANTRWNNAEAMIRRIENARKQIDKANASLGLTITKGYLDRKLKELRLTYEYREKLKEERDKRAEEARLKREEKRLEKQAADARKEEEKYEALLAKAREEAGVTTSEKQEAKIAELERQLALAHEKFERAQAMAERTKSGFVYIISNIGSFGENIVKIGLTRRLDPSDRVKELGDASVPFLFDTHAMIYSEEAPALEAALHTEFHDCRVNASNMRKEFFRTTLEEVEEAVKRLSPGAEFHKDIEAQEFRETIAKRQSDLERKENAENLDFPIEL